MTLLILNIFCLVAFAFWINDRLNKFESNSTLFRFGSERDETKFIGVKGDINEIKADIRSLRTAVERTAAKPPTVKRSIKKEIKT